MGVRFIIGRAGSGKTGHCFDQIVSALREKPIGPPIFWIVPQQATFQTERQLVCESGLPAVCRASVLSFSQLGKLISQQCGGIAIPEIDAAGRQMVIGHLLRAHQNDLQFFQSVARQPGLPAELDSTFTELERLGISADQLAGDIDDSPKLHDLRLLYDVYTKYLGQERLDQHRRFIEIVKQVQSWPALAHSTIFVDGYLEFADQERRLLAALARGCAHMEVTLLLDPASPVVHNQRHRPDSMNLFHRTEQTYLRLRAAFAELNFDIDEPVLLQRPQRLAASPIKHLESQLFQQNPKPSTSPSSDSTPIHLIQAPTRRSEVDAVARHIRKLVAEGYRLRDIAVLARDLNPYQELVAASFAEHGLSYFIDRRRSGTHHPLIRFTRLLPTLSEMQWPQQTMVSLLKSSLLGVAPDQADEIENYVLAHRIRGSAWESEEPWTFGSSDEQNAPALARINQIRRSLVDLLTPISNLLRSAAQLPANKIISEIFALFERCEIRKTLSQWIATAEAAGKLEEAAAHQQIWNETNALLQQMSDLLGDEPISAAEFSDILETGLERFDLALTPPTVDQVLVGTLERTRTPVIKAAILIGWHDGGFPRRPATGVILSDSDRDRINVGGGTERLLLDERLLAYFALTRAMQHVCITRPCGDDAGKQLAPSAFLAQITTIFPAASQTIVQRDCEEDCIGTPRQLTTALMRWARSPTVTIDNDSPWPALYQWLATHDADDSAIDQLRTLAWPALSYSNEAKLSPAIADQLFHSPLSAKISRLESFGNCPFQHFASYALSLRGRQDPDVTGIDLSRIYHSVLENVMSDMLRSKRDWTEPSPRTASAIHAHTRAVGKHLRDQIMISTGRNQYMLDRVERTLAQVIAAQEAVIRRGEFRPAKLDVRFGHDASLPAYSVTTKNGNRVDLSGTIDRIDVAGNQVSVSDYKLSAEKLVLDRVYHGLSLQLLTYLLVLQANGDTLVGRPVTPAAAFYVRLLRQLEDVDHPSQALSPDDPAIDLQVKPRGLFDLNALRSLDSQLASGPSDVVQVYVNKDGKIGKKNSSDAADTSEFTSLLRVVKKRIGESIDRLVTGDIRVMPVRIRQESPCARCDFLSVCRFDPAVNQYRILEPLGREEVLTRAKAE